MPVLAHAGMHITKTHHSLILLIMDRKTAPNVGSCNRLSSLPPRQTRLLAKLPCKSPAELCNMAAIFHNRRLVKTYLTETGCMVE